MKPCVIDEFSPCQEVIIHSPGEEHAQLIPWDGAHPLMGKNPHIASELKKDHDVLHTFLKEELGESSVFELSVLLTELFEQADGRKRFRILHDTLHHSADEYIDHLQARGKNLENYLSESIVEDLIQGYPRKLTVNNGRLPRIIIPPKRELMWMRDAAAVLPCGIVINELASPRRREEATLLRTLFKYHPRFDEDTIFLDFVEFHRKIEDDQSWTGLHDKYLLEGGNIIVLREDVLAIGVGRSDFHYSNRTTRPAFRKLVRKIFQSPASKGIQRIYLVNVPDLRGFIHLDTVFNMIGPKSALAMPYIFGYPNRAGSAKEVLQKFVEWLRKYMGTMQADLTKIPTKDHFDYAGRVEVYDRDHYKKTKQLEPIPQPARYFLDQLVDDGLIELDNISWIGGSPSDYSTPFEHLKVALFEQHNMAGNVFTAKPFRAISYHRNPSTLKDLNRQLKQHDPSTQISTMPSNEIRTDNGGPHCLTLPILRK